jgi:hypothetical protein
MNEVVDAANVVYARMKQPFAAFQDQEFRSWLADASNRNLRRSTAGSNENLLVETMGLEPTTPCLQIRPIRTTANSHERNDQFGAGK